MTTGMPRDDGIGYAPFHDNADLVPADLRPPWTRPSQQMADGELVTCPRERCGDISTLEQLTPH